MKVKDQYRDGNCPDCGDPIPDEATAGDECANCGHVFCEPADDAPSWVDKHSVNCIGCGELVDERECVPGKDGAGDVCPACAKAHPGLIDFDSFGKEEPK